MRRGPHLLLAVESDVGHVRVPLLHVGAVPHVSHHLGRILHYKHIEGNYYRGCPWGIRGEGKIHVSEVSMGKWMEGGGEVRYGGG